MGGWGDGGMGDGGMGGWGMGGWGMGDGAGAFFSKFGGSTSITEFIGNALRHSNMSLNRGS